MQFYGTVHLMDWMKSPIGQVNSIRGNVEIISDEQGVGFRARGHNTANWMARITGDSPDEVWNIFGCQVRSIVQHPPEFPLLIDTYTVGRHLA